MRWVLHQASAANIPLFHAVMDAAKMLLVTLPLVTDALIKHQKQSLTSRHKLSKASKTQPKRHTNEKKAVACAGQFNCCITQVADCYKESSKRIEDSTMESETINSANISKMELTIAPVDSKKLQIHHNTKLNSKNTSKRLARGVQHSAAI
uniref:AlNc14C167G7910 protein n=1 Tax=Albugo laibachii Nc14 TaxID=890382 RepID=F0WN78_9STRA|nr:AlNc14C167G7910 [Albugo laibachii Nc14]|eukprot:CCA22767.1 AlNc14C167G7910 [Albugo laibachii Nc14]